MINYLLEANLCLLIFGLFYLFLFKKDTDIQFRRLYLIGSTLLALLAPLLHLNVFSSSNTLSGLPTLLLPEIVIGNQSVNEAQTIADTINWEQYLYLGYWIFVIIIAQLFLFQLMQVAWFVFSKKTFIKKEGNIYIIYTNGTLPTFSFLNLLFFDNSVALTAEEKAKIMYHEMVHIEQRHSFDIILLEVVKILMWFNPFAWYFRREIQDIHEYLADDKVIRNTGAQQYTSLLAKMALNQAHLAIGHHFNKSKTLKRIDMMKQTKTKVKTWKMLMIIPVAALTIFTVSCNDEVMQDVDNVMETASQAEMPASLNDELAALQEKYPDADFTYIETDGASKESLNKLKDLDPKSIAYMNVDKDHNRIGIIVNKNGPIHKLNNNKHEGDVFQIVDDPAKPYGGYEALYERISRRLKYPKQAQKEGIEGKVYVQFIVDIDGSLTDIKVVKGIGAGCDQAAIDALAAENNWSAPMQRGKSVKQRIILPITFKLDDDPVNAAPDVVRDGEVN